MEIIIIAAVLGLIPGIIAERKGRSASMWWLFGTVMFIIALPASLVISPTPAALAKRKLEEGRVPCEHCAEYILPAARVCPFCRNQRLV